MATFDKTIQELTKLKAVTRPRSQGVEDFRLQMATMARGLVDLPDAAVESGCMAWAETSPWFPSLAELRAECIRHKPVAAASQAPRLAREGFTDKRWWHDRCAKAPHDAVLWARAAELYQSLYYADGGLIERGQVNFQAGDRATVPPQQSQAYAAEDVFQP